MLFYFYRFLNNKLRLSKPWKYKIPLLISFPYFMVVNGNLAHHVFITAIIAAFITTIGFLGIGYLSNDLSDRKKDQLAQKDNSLQNLKSWQITLLYLLFLCLALLPWKYLPLDRISFLLICLEFVLFLIYSFPPFRLKERKVLGLIADSLYAHTIPALLASWTFYLLIDKSYPKFTEFAIALFCWQFVSGFRNILSHQIKDYQNDINSGTKTWVTHIGLKKASQILKKILVPLEFITLLFFLVILQLEIIYILPIALIYWLFAFQQFKKKEQDKSEPEIKHFTNLMLDDFYIKWLPLITLSGIIFILTEVRTVLFIHLLLFFGPIQNGISNLFQQSKQKFIHSKLIQVIFGFKGYYRGFILHLALLLLYTLIFCGLYFLLQNNIDDVNRFIYLQGLLSKLLVLIILAHLGSFFLFRKEKSIAELKSFFLEESSAYNLAIFRIIAFFIIVRSFTFEVFGSFEKWSHLPETSKVGLPFIAWLIDLIPINPEIYQIAAYSGLALAYCGLLGFQTKWTLKLYIPIALYLWGVPCFFGKLNHHHIMVWVPIILAFSPCSNVLSIDALLRRIRKKKEKNSPPIEYSLPFKFIWITLASIYCCSGFHKLWDTGLYWALSDNLINQIQLEWIENYDVPTELRIDRYPSLLKLSGILVILFEIIYPFFLLKPATRFINFAGSWMLHLTAGYFLNIDFGYLRRMHYSLFNWKKWVMRIRNKVPKTSDAIEVKEVTFAQLKKYPIFYVGSILVGMNLIFGILGISSWPFSAYPAYSGIIKDEIHLIEMQATDAFDKPINVKEIGQKENFRWENIRPFEERIAAAVLTGDTSNLNQKLIAYWQLWSTKVPQLEKVKSIRMTLITTSLVPEERHIVLAEQHLGVINID
ncbi:MAG: UbiA family prenyltransferase [Flavobacteriales bacterium]|nr:UbiA family prenyltransferase [Flavobacteriales bacterium]